ncbi:hypothetical protein V6N11_010391 [Hibiscus sabdariffa]|uniref:Uncharacterized protein n=1 Tax=Hibiscus sabdariffa TaxID=183260 RepID=A0ABR2S558_9ROSI
MCQINRQIPREICPQAKEQALWDTWPEDPCLLTPYHKAIMEVQSSIKMAFQTPLNGHKTIRGMKAVPAKSKSQKRIVMTTWKQYLKMKAHQSIVSNCPTQTGTED